MKKFNYVLFFVALTSIISCATKNAVLDNLGGTWLLKNNESDVILEYQRITDQSRNKGSILNISHDSVIVDSYTLECHNGKSTFFSEGIWSLNKKNLILKSTVPIDLQGQTFKIKELDSTTLVLAKITSK